MADQVIGITIKGIGDFSDVVSNVDRVQKALTKLKLPDKLKDNLSKNISNFSKEYEKYQKKISEGIKTQGDQNAVNKSLNSMLSSYQKIINEFNKISPKDFKEIFKLDEGAFSTVQKKIRDIQTEFNKIKLDPKKITDPLNQISKLTKANKIVGKDGAINLFKEGMAEGGVEGLKKADAALTILENHFQRFKGQMTNKNTRMGWEEALRDMRVEVDKATTSAAPLVAKMNDLGQEMGQIGARGMSEFKGMQQGLKDSRNAAEKVTDELKRMHESEFSFNRQVQDIDRQIQSYFGLAQMIRKVGDIARSAFNTVKELDAAMTETAVVTNFDVGDMWDMLPTYTEQANQLGSTIKDVYDAATLYYQQGLNTNQAMGLANETLKMARIAGMDAAEATDMMTAALRGFNMEINQASAQKVNDIYSQLAAVTASDTREIGTAMEKTASLASSANMKIETTSAFLAQMIETTREAPENLGTAMKTIIARFQEMKQDPTKLVDSEGQAMDVNKIDTALKSIGVALTNTKGEFRDLDDVFLDISAKWDSLTQGQQRYIATTAAGSRQQSRFIAMMSNYDRTMELVNEANNSAGASQKQYEKTLDSMSTKLNQLQNAWNQFTMGLMNNQILKTGITALTGFFTAVNKIIDVLGNIPPDPFKGITKSILTLGATFAGLNFAKNFSHGLVTAGAGWWNNENTFGANFKEGSGWGKKIDPSFGPQISSKDRVQRITQEKITQAREKQITKEIERNLKAQQAQQTNVITQPSSIAHPLSVPMVKAPFDVQAYLEKVEGSNLHPMLVEKIEEELGEGPITVDKIVRVNEIIDPNDVGGELGFEELKIPVPDDIVEGGAQVEKVGVKFDGLGVSIANAGMILQDFGNKLGPFGGIFTAVGTAMTSVGTSIASMTASLQANLVVAAENASAMEGDAMATLADALSKEGLTAANLKAAWSAGILQKQLLSLLIPFGVIIVAVGALVAAYFALDAAIETDAERLERFTNAANTASDAYSSAKQEMSELTDSLEQIQSNEDSFEGLVAGTAEFNDKLTEANQKISELLLKYPELNDPNFLSTDENGLMHISKEGIDFIKKQQAQMVGNASALNTLQNARLKAEEYRQKSEDNEKQLQKITNPTQGDANAIMNNVKVDRTLTKEDKRKIADLKKEAKYNKENADNVEKMARQQAISNSLTNVEVGQRDKIASIYADTYDIALKRAEAEAKDVGLEDKKKAYADFYGYNYDTISKKMTDREGEEVKVDDSIINDAYSQITVLANVEASGESLDKMMNTIDAKFARGIGASSEESRNLLTDILSRNAETDANAIKKILDDPGKMEEAIQKLSEEERAALLNMTQEEFDDDIKKYTDQLIKKANKAAKDIDKQQAQSREDLGRMLMQSQYGSVERAKHIADKSIVKQISDLKADQVNLLATVGKSLEENVGAEAMTNFVSSATDIYSKGGKQAQKQLTDILNATQWDSATSRLAAYTKMINSNNQAISEMGKSMRGVSNESNLLGNVFDEFLGGDWQEISENIDNFKNATGEIDSSGILKMSEQSGKLKILLDSGQVSASGLSKALQGINSGSIYQVNQTVLQLLSTMDSLTDSATKAHNIIENFDAGIDTGEGEDFIKENAKKFKEYYNHEEYGNEQLQNYIKLAAGTDKWNKTLKENKGDIEATVKALDHYVTTFSEGFQPAWEQMVKDEGINGKSLKENIKNADISDKLKEKFGKVDFLNEDGYLDIKIGDLTTDELETYFEKVYGVSKEYASLLMQNLTNYNTKIGQELDKNNLDALVETDEFQNAHRDINTGKVALAGSDLRAYRDAGGDMDQLARNLGYKNEAEMWKNDFKTTKNGGKERTDYPKLLNDYIGKFFGKDGDLFKAFESGYKQFDISKMMDDALTKGMSDTQSLNSAFEAYQRAQEKGLTTTYNGMTLEGDFKTVEEFEAAISSMTESNQWVQVGQTIGQQIVSAMEASALLDKVRNGGITEEEKAFDSNGKTTQAFEDVINATKTSGESREKQQQDITEYLKSSQEQFKNLTPEKQAEALQGVVGKLNELNFKPEEISAAIRNGLGINFDTGSEGRGALKGEKGQVTLDPDKALVTLKEQLGQLEGTITTVNTPKDVIDQAFGNLTANIKGVVTSLTTGNPGLATGQNNPGSAFHRVGTMARGSRGGYTISGRPTLTGEEGEELVWEPKRNEAYMVGSNGPQFANISKNAVVWNADQTRRIKKNSGSVGRVGTGARGITPVGTMNGGNADGGGGGNSLSWPTPIGMMAEITEVIPLENYKMPVIVEPIVQDSGKDGGKKEKGEESVQNTVNNEVSLKSSVTNPNEPKEKIKSSLPNPFISTIQANFTLNTTSVQTGNLKSKLQSKANSAAEGLKVNTKAKSVVETEANTKPAETQINNIKRKKPVEIKTHAQTGTAQSAINSISGTSVNVDIYPHFKGTWEHKVKITKDNPHTGGMITSLGPIYRARGGIASNPMFKREGTDTIPAMLTPGEYVHNRDAVKYFGVDFMRRINHRDLNGALESFGSSAKGRYGTIGPKDKGGLTLTGEKGYEIAWLPSENRSMVLGVGGPQMIALPDDAVVYTHKQSEDILKRKSINAGSHKNTSIRLSSNKGDSNSGNNRQSGNSGKGRKGGKRDKKDKDNTKATKKIIDKAGKLSVWWENQTRKVDAVQRQVDKTAKTFDKSVSQFGATFKSIKGDVNTYINRLYKSINLNKDSQNKANNALKSANKDTTKSKSERVKANKEVKAAKKTYNKNKKSKKAKEKLDKAKKKRDKAYGRTTSISWDVVEKKKDKKGKTTKKTVKKKENINLSKYINYDKDLDVYTVNQKQLNKIKSKNKKKAINEAAKKKIDDYQSKKNTATDNITKAQEALETINQKIYDTFISWEIELTKIWNITQKISEIEAKTSRLKEATSLQEAQLASGLNQATKEFNAKSINIFRAQLGGMGKTIEQQGNLIKEQRSKILESINGTSDKETLANLNAKITANNKTKTYNKNVDTKINKKKTTRDNKKKAYDKAKEKVSSLDKKKEKLEKKLKNKNLSAKDKKAVKKELKTVNQQLKQAKAQQKTAKNAYNKANDDYNKTVKKNPKKATFDAETEIKYKQQQKYLQEQEKIRSTAAKYMKTEVRDDGTISIDFNTEKFEQDKQNIGITADDATKIQNYVKDLNSQSEELNQSYTDLTQSLTELYTTLADLQEEQADNSEKLLSVVEDEQQKNIDDIKQISESINESINDLFNEVKNRLTERRNREDNAKTEQDITQKQQRLAALRADTSGGNAVEIAQLEKEIAEARQSYGRNLEDQLLDNLQEQADEASKQRETMIELQQALLETTTKDSNLAKVNEWMNAIDLYSRGLIEDDEMKSIWEEIQEKYFANEEYDSKTDARQAIIRKDFEELKNQLSTNATRQDITKEEIAGVTTSIGETKSSLDLLKGSIDSLVEEYAKENEENKENDKNNEEEDKDNGGGNDNTSDKDILAKPVQSFPTLSASQVATSTSTLRVNPKDEYKRKIAAAASNKKIGKKELQNVAKKAKDAGVGTKKYLQDLANTAGLTWKQILTAAKAAGYNKNRLAATFNSDNFKKAFDYVYGKGAYTKARKKKAKSYATGGLANYTGPAWLDGTPSKPELVLNAKDTQNFLALKDVLSNAISSIGSTNNAYTNSEFNININVDKIDNDYDVDRIITKVKKEITKSAGYRNVTQARSLR